MLLITICLSGTWTLRFPAVSTSVRRGGVDGDRSQRHPVQILWRVQPRSKLWGTAHNPARRKQFARQPRVIARVADPQCQVDLRGNGVDDTIFKVDLKAQRGVSCGETGHEAGQRPGWPALSARKCATAPSARAVRHAPVSSPLANASDIVRACGRKASPSAVRAMRRVER